MPHLRQHPSKDVTAKLQIPALRCFALLQAHFSRMQLPADLAADQAIVLGKILNVLRACERFVLQMLTWKL